MTPKVRIFRALLPAGFLAVPALAIPVQAQVTKRGGPTASRVKAGLVRPSSVAPGTPRRAVASPATTSRTGWSITPTPNPTAPTGQLLFGTCASASSCIAVGTHINISKVGVTLAERWNGQRWNGQRTPNPAGARVSSLAGVSCTAPSACAAVGDSVSASGTETTLVERWNGHTWHIQRTPNPAGSRQSALIAVACPTSSACTAVGTYVNRSGTQVNLAERWDGRKWRIQHTPNPPGAQFGFLDDVSCAASSACTAVGLTSQGTLAERWNGNGWQIQHTPNPPQGGGGLLGVACVSPSSCTAVGGSNAGTLAERWNGSKWHIQPTPNPPGLQFGFLNGVDCSSRSVCTGVGGYSTGSGDFHTLAERWNRHGWTIQHTQSPGGAQGDLLAGVACPSSSGCVAFGFSRGSGTPRTMAQRWNGATWRLQGTQNPVGAAETQLNSVACPSTSSCYAVGTAGPTRGITSAVAQHWNGTRWQTERIPTVPGVSLNAVSCASLTECFAVGQSRFGVLAERWNGTRWKIQGVPTPAGGHSSGLGGISCTSTSFCMAAGAYFTTSNQSGPAKPFAERWNGRRWRILAIPEPAGAVQTFFGSVSCTSRSSCMAVGEQHSAKGVVHTVAERWNGASWSVQPTPNPPHAPGASLSGVACPGPSDCIAAGLMLDSFGNPGGVLAERWNGSRWTIQPAPSPAGALGLSNVACSGHASCTAVGLSSTGLGGMVLAERWNGAKWQIQPTPFIPALSVRTSSPPAVACPTRTACSAVAGYEAPGPTSVTLAERWDGIGGKGQSAARPGGHLRPAIACLPPTEPQELIRTSFDRVPVSPYAAGPCDLSR